MPHVPQVSVVMPAYNAEAYIPRAIASVLAQTFGDFELIVVDDGSTDATLEIVRKLASSDQRICWETGPNRGVVGARNLCLERVRAPLMAVHDADDVALPERLRKQVDYLSRHPECVAVGGAMRYRDPDGLDMGEYFHLLTHEQIDGVNLGLTGCGLGHSSVMMRTEAIRAAGGYREGFDPAEDLDLWLRLAERGQLANLPEVLIEYQLHRQSLTYTRASRQAYNATRAVNEARQRRHLPLLPVAAMPQDEPPVASRPRTPAEKMWMIEALRNGNYVAARRLGFKCLSNRPFSGLSWRLAMMGLLGPRVPTVVACLKSLQRK